MKTKKFTKKLGLSKETIVHLDNAGMQAVKGGEFTIGGPSCWPNCPIISVIICPDSVIKPCS